MCIHSGNFLHLSHKFVHIQLLASYHRDGLKKKLCFLILGWDRCCGWLDSRRGFNTLGLKNNTSVHPYLSRIFFHSWLSENLSCMNRCIQYQVYCICVRILPFLFGRTDELEEEWNIKMLLVRSYVVDNSDVVMKLYIPFTQVVLSSANSKSSSQEQICSRPFLLQIWEHAFLSLLSQGCTVNL